LNEIWSLLLLARIWPLSLVGVGFDSYNAYRSFSQLSTETDPDIRKNLIVSGSLSVAGAAVGLGVTAAFIAGGAVAAAAGPIGLVVGAALMLTGLIYSAVRQVEEIEKHIYLSASEKWDTGWRVFLGNHPLRRYKTEWLKHSDQPTVKCVINFKKTRRKKCWKRAVSRRFTIMFTVVKILI